MYIHMASYLYIYVTYKLYIYTIYTIYVTLCKLYIIIYYTTYYIPVLMVSPNSSAHTAGSVKYVHI